MIKRTAKLVVSSILAPIVLIATTGCQSIGSSESFKLKYKKDLAEYYQEGINKPDDGTRGQTVLEANTYLPEVFSTDIQYSLTNHYDTRNPAKNNYAIRAGDPVNIIINKVFLADNSELLPQDTGEIAVVVSIDDGKSDPKNVLVSYEEGIVDNVFLPISDLLAYHTDAYEDQPIKISVTVFEFDRAENENYKKVLGTATNTAAAALPAYAPAIAFASQIGNFLIDQNKDDIIAKFTFQLYPWEAGTPQRVTRGIGVPRISYGHYIVINSCASQYVFTNNCDTETHVNRDKTIHVTFDLDAYELNDKLNLEEIKDKGCAKDVVVCKEGKIRPWPTQLQPIKKAQPLKKSYVVMTVEKTQVRHAQPIIDRLHELNMTIAGLDALTDIQTANVAALGQQLDTLNSNIAFFLKMKELQRAKSDPYSLGSLFDLVEGNLLNDSDKQATAKRIGQLLFPSMTSEYKTANNIGDETPTDLAILKRWYTKVKSNLQYDSNRDGYTCITAAACK